MKSVITIKYCPSRGFEEELDSGREYTNKTIFTQLCFEDATKSFANTEMYISLDKNWKRNNQVVNIPLHISHNQ